MRINLKRSKKCKSLKRKSTYSKRSTHAKKLANVRRSRKSKQSKRFRKLRGGNSLRKRNKKQRGGNVTTSCNSNNSPVVNSNSQLFQGSHPSENYISANTNNLNIPHKFIQALSGPRPVFGTN